MNGGAVVSHLISSIGPASAAQRAHAAARARGGGPLVEQLAGALAAAQHAAPRARRRALVVALGDHGAGDPGVSLGAEHPTVAAARSLVDGDAALCQLARAARAELVVVDFGCAEPAQLPPTVVGVGRRPSGDARLAAALTVLEVQAALEAGAAVAVSLIDAGVDVLGVGALGLGAEVGALALSGALLSEEVWPAARAEEPPLVELGRALVEQHRSTPLELVGAFAGPEQAALVGLVLAAAAMNVPVILDGESTVVAAALAARLAPPCAGYLLASQRGSGAQPALLDHLGLAPVFAGGVGHGEGAGAAMVLALLDQLEPMR